MRYELQPYLEQKKRILRPANFAPQCPGRGWGEYSVRGGPICVINLMGRFTLDTNTDNPFLVVDDILEQTQAKIVLVDMHAEARAKSAPWAFISTARDGRLGHAHARADLGCRGAARGHGLPDRPRHDGPGQRRARHRAGEADHVHLPGRLRGRGALGRRPDQARYGTPEVHINFIGRSSAVTPARTRSASSLSGKSAER